MTKREKMANPRVFLDLNIGGQPAGRHYPHNSRELLGSLNSEKGIGKNGKPFHYKGTIFHLVIPMSMFNGGDITEGNGLRGESIYDDSFTDENFVNKHTNPGILSMANTSPETNGSQFLICTTKTKWLDGTNIIFGQVVKGFDVMKAV
ncbi:hypothetical protein Dsin_019055 [Dipteronia sinensis]|uniref:Peptidyl-prolyl cis-trans isomerase n=1 Tax=Dipteronia sinensis TaxID=43782 RepID=A0AAE0A7B5_9ROSI|nr:hypothetical protein Dsin_019055 [Dipteronia sinensis]